MFVIPLYNYKDNGHSDVDTTLDKAPLRSWPKYLNSLPRNSLDTCLQSYNHA